METPTATNQKQAKPKFFSRRFLSSWGAWSLGYGAFMFFGAQGFIPYLVKYLEAKDRIKPVPDMAWWELPQLLIAAPLFEIVVLFYGRPTGGFDFRLVSIGPTISFIGLGLSAILGGFCLAWAGRKVLELLRSR